jgi:hypothetical protein
MEMKLTEEQFNIIKKIFKGIKEKGFLPNNSVFSIESEEDEKREYSKENLEDCSYIKKKELYFSTYGEIYPNSNEDEIIGVTVTFIFNKNFLLQRFLIEVHDWDSEDTELTLNNYLTQ